MNRRKLLSLPRLRILHLLSQRPDSTGSGVYVQAMLREAATYNHDNFLVAGVQADGPAEMDVDSHGRRALVRFGTPALPYPIVGMSDVMPYPSVRFCDLSQQQLHQYEMAFSKQLEAVVTAFEPDLIHSHHLWIVSSLARRLFPGLPVVATCHGSDLRQFQQCRHLQDRVLAGCRRLSKIMSLTAAQKDEIVRLYDLAPSSISVVGGGYNDALFRSSKKPDPDPVQLVYAGKLSRAKGVPWLLRALSTITGPPWVLHLVGDGHGEERDECLMLARELGKQIVVHGAVPQGSLAEVMKRSHILVLPSFYEGLGLVVLEGLASGCSIVATDLPALKEIFGDVKVDFVNLVKAPRLRRIDQPYPQEGAAFEHRLRQALQAQIRAAYQRPDIDTSPMRHTLEAFAWKGIFRKVQRVYFEAIEKQDRGAVGRVAPNPR